jgi:hypothetical protein
MFKKIICGVLQDKEIFFELPAELRLPPPVFNGESKVAAFGNQTLAQFWLDNQTVGLPMEALLTVRAELEALKIFDDSEIAWLDRGDGLWRYWHPVSLLGTFRTEQEWNKDVSTLLAQVTELLARAVQGLPLGL